MARERSISIFGCLAEQEGLSNGVVACLDKRRPCRLRPLPDQAFDDQEEPSSQTVARLLQLEMDILARTTKAEPGPYSHSLPKGGPKTVGYHQLD